MRALGMIVVLLIACSLDAASSARAQEPTTDEHFETAAARALFQEGVALAHGGDYGEATDRFRRAQALHPAPSVAFNLASALIHEGQLVEAFEILEGVLRDPTSTPDLIASARRQRDDVAPRIARLTLQLEGPSHGVSVEIDAHGVHTAAIGVAVPIDPGTHEIRAVRDGEVAVEESIDLAEGEVRAVSLVIPSAELLPETILDDPPPIERLDARADTGGSDDGVWIALGVCLGVVAAVAVTTTVLVLEAEEGEPHAVAGNTSPAVLTW